MGSGGWRLLALLASTSLLWVPGQGQPRGLFPAILNLASNAHISTNATCGEKGPEMFCKLVEHVPGRPLRNAQCRVCDRHSTNPKGKLHVFQVAYVIIKAANAPRPGNWILERSIDGTEFRPWQYYAISDTECLTRYNITPRIGPPTYKRDDEVICTSYYSRLVPLEHGEIHTSLINGRPSADDPSQKLLEFTSARYIRLRLQRIRTLNADLMTLSHNDPKELDPIVTRRYYYSIKDISVGGMCICYGHARSCPLDEITKVSPYEDHPCYPCDCDPFGSLSSVCVKDEHHSDSQHGTWPGQCQCREGYGGEKCDRCAFGYQGYPNCLRCNCSLVGSINEDPCMEPCLCKENVEGENCDLCKPGFYNLQERNPQGCTECFCFGVSDVCDSLTWPISQISDMTGWLVTDLYKARSVQPQRSQFDGPHQISINNTEAVKVLKNTYYWSAPEAYLGNKLTAFSGDLKYSVSYDIPMESVDSDIVSSVDVIIQGNGKILSTRAAGLSLQPYEEYSNSVRFVPENFIEFNTKKAIDREMLMTVLANVTHLLIRANYNIAKKAVYRLDSVTLDNANANVIDLSSAPDVEFCECPQGYTGISCESCLPGYYRVDGILFGGICQPCKCNGHATECDIHGVCFACQHNTTGPFCDQCLPGFYGNPSRGTSEDCQPCACPLSSAANNFSPTCQLSEEGGIVCDKCLPGYTGSQCERCTNGYYGNPLMPGQLCAPCECNGNVNPQEEGHCDPFTGQCLKCLGNTAGHHCEKCADGYYGDAVIDKNCRACDCAHTQNNCNADSGQCICPPHTQGQKCELCEENYWGLSPKLGCKACNCSNTGSADLQCDVLTGQCQCKIEFGGRDCSRCALGYRDYPDCVACDCDLSGTRAETCNDTEGVCGCEEESGVCTCKENVFGLQCSECKPGTFGLSANNVLGCTPCFCFGMSTSCSELEDHVRIPITLTPDQAILRVVAQSNLTGTVEGVFSQFPDVLLDAAIVRKYLNTETFYWKLPEQFQGDQLMAYGGKLRYIVAFYALDGFGTSNFEPQILMKGGHSSKLVIYVDIPSPENAVRTDMEVEMKEDSWKYFNSVSDKPVLRSDFMSVLSNVEYILIRAAYGQGLQQSRIANISMEIAVKFEEMHLGRPLAHLIEQSCDDNCTGVLLNSLDNLNEAVLSVNLTGIDRLPYGILSELENATQHLRRSIVPKEDPAYSLDTAKENLLNLSGGIDHLHEEVVLAEVAFSLNETLGLDLPLSNATSQSLQDDISALLDALRKKDFFQQHHNATTALRAAEKLLTQVQKEYLKPQQELAELKAHASQFLSKQSSSLQDAQHLVNEALTNINETHRLFPLISSNLAELNDKKLKIKEGEEVSTTLIKEGKVLLNAAAALALDVKNSTFNVEVHQDGLVLWSTKLRHHVDELVMQMSVRGVLDLVYRAEEHATQFQRLADALESDLSRVRSVTLNATAAIYTHSSVKSVIERTESLADDASRVVNGPLDLPEESFSLLGKETLLLSSKFENDAKNLKKKSDGLLFGLNGLKKKVEKIQESTNKIGNQLNDSLLTLRALPNNTGKSVLEVKELAVSANTSAVVDLSHFGEFRQKLMNTSSTLSQVNDTLRKTSELITDSSKAAFTAEKQIKEVEAQASLLLDRLKPLKMLEENLNRNLSEIKELISQARKQAASIKVAVSADRDCIRAYQPQISSTNYNTLTLNVKTAEPDNLLFYLGSNGKTDFLALEMRRGKVALLWDLGSGSTRVEYPDFQIDNNKWHRIHATSPQDEDTSFHFDGSGYSVVEKALRSTVTQIIIFFSTFSPNGLLLYLASNGTRDFLSLELVDGKVRVTVDLGSGPLALTTENHYNNGTWYKISFNRNKKQGVLAVMDAYNLNYKETKQGESPGVASDLNRSDKDPIFIGGLPRSRALRKGLNSRMYVGCIKNLEISRSTFDLLRNSYGVRKGCVLEPFFSIMLIDGHLAVHVNAGDRASTRKVVLQSANGTYSDGQEHSVILIRNKRIITVQVDESKPAELRLGSAAENSPINISNFYAGGIPAGEGILGLKLASSFHGCISNLIFNKELLYFTTSMKYEHVDMDSCFLSEKPNPAVQPIDIVIQPEFQALPVPLRPLTDTKKVVCAKDELPDHVQGAHQFGLAKGSHLTLLFNQSAVRKKLSVQLNLRTFASSGLIYYMAHQNQVDYAALQLYRGQLHFSFDLGKGKAVALHPAVVSDGKWHTVKTEYVKRKGTIIVDGQELVTVNVLGDGSTLDVEGKLYVGGLPLDYVPKNLGNVTHSIPACIGSLTINSKQLDNESPVSIFAVNKCYETVQDGTFFDGSGFAALVREGYKVRSDVNITLEFRTTAVHGVLLGVSSAKVDAIGLEIVHGKVLFHVNNGAGRITATYEPRGTNSLCDGKWHKLQANKSKHHISLIIDGNLVHAENPYIQSTSADTNNPIYVGGYPADVKQNCLTSKSSFRGCLRNLVLTKGQHTELFDFSRAFDLRGVFPHSCPGAEH
ncbi:hypothetical protein DUI87_07750 [Hirundo rustica rustica]|uniref:Laminin A chain n=2 Tax=Hirundo rustica TaxID=43150 RepID=A0A3M0KVU9_HIRRU|nr:hypothetical protein DUI87_07750 [Hirundo rustica rustica]